MHGKESEQLLEAKSGSQLAAARKQGPLAYKDMELKPPSKENDLGIQFFLRVSDKNPAQLTPGPQLPGTLSRQTSESAWPMTYRTGLMGLLQVAQFVESCYVAIENQVHLAYLISTSALKCSANLRSLPHLIHDNSLLLISVPKS